MEITRCIDKNRIQGAIVFSYKKYMRTMMSEGNGNPDPLSYLIGKTLPNIINSQYPEGLDNAEMRRQFIEAALDIFNKIGLTGINATGLYTTLFPNNRSDVES